MLGFVSGLGGRPVSVVSIWLDLGQNMM